MAQGKIPNDLTLLRVLPAVLVGLLFLLPQMGGESTPAAGASTLRDAGRGITDQQAPSFVDATNSVRVCKQIIPPDASTWTFLLEGAVTETSSALGDGECYTFQNLPNGSYGLHELYVPAGYAANSSCDNGDWLSDGTSVYIYSLGQGGQITCTFTNQQYGSITIINDTVPDDSQDFSLICTPGDPPLAAFYLDDDSDNTLTNSITQSVPPWTYSCSEFQVTGWQTSISCDDSDSSGSGSTATIVLAPAESVTCTFLNTFRPGAPPAVGGVVGLIDGERHPAATAADDGRGIDFPKGALGAVVVVSIVAASLWKVRSRRAADQLYR